MIPLINAFSKLSSKRILLGKLGVTTSYFNKREYSTVTNKPSNVNITPLKSDRLLTVHKIGKPTPLPPLTDLVFGQFFSDHMLEIDWDSTNGWHTPIIKPFAPLQLHPACSALHYALQCFEGLKGYKDANNNIRLFRPEENMSRFRMSCERLGLPSFDEKELLDLIIKLLKIDESFIPNKDGYSIYIRPTAIATQPTLGVAPPSCAKIYVVLSPVGPYYQTGFKPVNLLADTKNVRSWPGGSGHIKIGANYAPTIFPQLQASKNNYGQILWLLPKYNTKKNIDDFILTEVGTMNLFVKILNEKNQIEVITPPLENHVILPGVTRDSVIKIIKECIEKKVKVNDDLDFSNMVINEKNMFMKSEFLPLLKNNKILEVFGTGTAAVITPVKIIGFENENLEIPLDVKNKNAGGGPLANFLLQKLYDIQYGRCEHKFSKVI